MLKAKLTKKATKAYHTSLLSGTRTVKTAKFTPELVKVIESSNVPIEKMDISGWCDLQFTVKELYPDNETVKLQYKIPNSKNGCVDIFWPIAGLAKQSN